ncbi:hypothetical protein SAMN04489707_10254 [Paenacidovorax caeni]|uniref:Integrase core domain-containing protein n=1 Tax=Paenacidovorax caeni TaxID=343013 RepID=A0A1I7JDQ7_9BURK|nr:hypothetical protein SAMN04489707_10254 [Paenacidovorax caeni]
MSFHQASTFLSSLLQVSNDLRIQAETGIEPSVGSKGNSYDNALAETQGRGGPWKTKQAVERATLEWVSWFNLHRLRGPLGSWADRDRLP